ncbi:hypothetical protein WA556_002303 [Blastocystis sp. ATCC 50177/Nand II]
MFGTPLRRFASTVNSAVFQKYGNPLSVLKMQATQLKALCSKDVQIKMVASAMSAADLCAVSGRNPAGFAFPAVAGSEGVGIVEKVGSGVSSLKENQMVMLIKPFQGTWTERAVVSEDALLAVPNGLAPEIACHLLGDAGAAYKMLTSFADLKAGDVVLQNDACSPIGRCVVQLCKARGIKTVNIVKDCPKCDACGKKMLEEMGGDIVVSESQLDGTDLKKSLSALPPVKLVLNGRGGCVMSEVLKMVRGVDVVTYCESSCQPFRASAAELMTQSLSLRGFSMNCWLKSAKKEEVAALVGELAGAVAKGELKFNTKEVKFEEVMSCVEKAANSTCGGTRVIKL